MFLYKLVRHQVLAIATNTLTVIAIVIVANIIVPSVPGVFAAILGLLYGAFIVAIIVIEDRGGYVSKDKRVWFVNNILAPKLRDIVATLAQGHQPGPKSVKEVLADYWAIRGHVQHKDDIVTSYVLAALYDTFLGQNLRVEFGESLIGKKGGRINRRPHLIVRGKNSGRVYLNVNG